MEQPRQAHDFGFSKLQSVGELLKWAIPEVCILQGEKIASVLLEVFIPDCALQFLPSNLLVLGVAKPLLMQHRWEKNSDDFSSPTGFYVCECLGWMHPTIPHLLCKYFCRRESKCHKITAMVQVMWIFFLGRSLLNAIIHELWDSLQKH